MPEKSERKILFVVPTAKDILANTVLAAMKIAQRPDIEYMAIKGQPIDQVRNDVAQMTLDDKSYTHCLMMDSDIVPPDNIVDMLLECESPLAGAIAPICINNDITSNAMVEVGCEVCRLTSWGDKTEPFEMKAVGAGCILIERKVLEDVPWPWFKDVKKQDGSRMGEDVYFCYKAAEYGYKFKVHPKAVCSHFKLMDLLELVKAFS